MQIVKLKFLIKKIQKYLHNLLYIQNHTNIYKEFFLKSNMDKRPFRTLLNKQVVTKEGKKLGLVKDITFEARTGELIHIVLRELTTYTSNLSLERTKDKEALIPHNAVIAVGDFIVVSEEDLL